MNKVIVLFMLALSFSVWSTVRGPHNSLSSLAVKVEDVGLNLIQHQAALKYSDSSSLCSMIEAKYTLTSTAVSESDRLLKEMKSQMGAELDLRSDINSAMLSYLELLMLQHKAIMSCNNNTFHDVEDFRNQENVLLRRIKSRSTKLVMQTKERL